MRFLKKFDLVLSQLLQYFIAGVWLVNGLFCKILNLVPRHQQIVARILGEEHAFVLTKTIGSMEVLMALWIVSRIYSKTSTIIQIFLVAAMNIIEFILAPDLLLFGRLNIVIAMFFIMILFFNEVLYQRHRSSPTFNY